MKRTELLCSISNLNGGGAERVMLYLLEHLPDLGFDVTFAIGERSGQFATLLPPALRVVELGTLRGYRAVRPFRALLRAGKFDVAFSMTSFNMTAVLSRIALPGTRTKVVLGVRNHYSSALAREASLPAVRKAFVRALYPRADHIICVAERARTDLVDRFHVPPSRTETIHNPVDIAMVRRRAAEAVVDSWLQERVPVFVNVGKLMEAKGQDVLLDAFERVLRSGIRARLIILGTGPLRETLVSRTHELGISDHVKFCGFHMNPYAFMARATAFVLSSRWEGFPNVLVEAMAAGAAVISTDCPSGPAEIIVDRRSGLLVPVGEPEALASAMSEVARTPTLREDLRSGAAVDVKRFDLPVIVERYAAAFRRVAGIS